MFMNKCFKCREPLLHLFLAETKKGFSGVRFPLFHDSGMLSITSSPKISWSCCLVLLTVLGFILYYMIKDWLPHQDCHFTTQMNTFNFFLAQNCCSSFQSFCYKENHIWTFDYWGGLALGLMVLSFNDDIPALNSEEQLFPFTVFSLPLFSLQNVLIY